MAKRKGSEEETKEKRFKGDGSGSGRGGRCCEDEPGIVAVIRIWSAMDKRTRLRRQKVLLEMCLIWHGTA